MNDAPQRQPFIQGTPMARHVATIVQRHGSSFRRVGLWSLSTTKPRSCVAAVSVTPSLRASGASGQCCTRRP